MRRPANGGWIVVVLIGSMACSELETNYFQSRVNEATAQVVAKRYGPPHKVEQRDGDQTVWTYFNRGSAHQAMPVRPFNLLRRVSADI